MFSKFGKSKIFLKVDMSFIELKSSKMAIDDKVLIQWKTAESSESSAVYSFLDDKGKSLKSV